MALRRHQEVTFETLIPLMCTGGASRQRVRERRYGATAHLNSGRIFGLRALTVTDGLDIQYVHGVDARHEGVHAATICKEES